MSFPKFPKFRKFSVLDKDAYLPYYSSLEEPCCDFCIDDLLVWLDYNNDLEVSNLYGNLVFRFTNILYGRKYFYSLLGTKRLRATIDSLSDYLLANDTHQISYVPEQITNAIRALDLPYLKIEEDHENNDYVYNVPKLAAMEGKLYEGVRGRVNNFTKDNENIHLEPFDLRLRETREDIIFHIEEWSKKGSYKRNDPEKWEQPAIEKHLSLAEELPLYGYGIYTNDALTCVVLFNRPPHRDWIIASHIKCDYGYREVYGYALHSLAVVANQLGVQWINFEQDLGKDGLRWLKMSFRPEKFIRRYTVSIERARHQ